MAELRLDFCSHEAALFACQRWHYSRCMPAGKMVKVGIWEDGKFIRVVLYSCGASPPMYKWAETNLGCKKQELCELTRVAMTDHVVPVSKVLAISLKLLKKACPGLRCVVSFADCDESHHGGIYQATNWTYVGVSNAGGRQGYMVNGRKMHCRSVGAASGENSLAGARRLDSRAVEVRTLGKHKYLMPLDSDMQQIVSKLKKPYPKRTNDPLNSGGESKAP